MRTVTQVNRSQLDQFLKASLGGTLPPCPNVVGHELIPHDERRGTHKTWCREYARFELYWASGQPQYRIFSKENRKLNFPNWSVLPIVTCPGAGACISFCYSLKSWVHPGAFYRQLQNTLLLQSVAGRAHIAAEFMSLPAGPLRLYSDGDIDGTIAEDGINVLQFWFNLLDQRRDILALGYSKSWGIFLDHNAQGLPFPTNYVLNLSSGSIYGDNIKARMEALPITRGTFEAHNIGVKIMPDRRTDRAAWLAYSRALKAKAGYKKSFVCPGRCYDCIPGGGIACGSARFKGIPILINVH